MPASCGGTRGRGVFDDGRGEEDRLLILPS
jgi:hypothetical protein